MPLTLQLWHVKHLVKVSSKLYPKNSGECSRNSSGRRQAIVLAQEMKVVLLMDESAGRAFAEAWGLKTKGRVYAIMLALRTGLISKDGAKDTVVKMVSNGFRIEPNLLA